MPITGEAYTCIRDWVSDAIISPDYYWPVSIGARTSYREQFNIVLEPVATAMETYVLKMEVAGHWLNNPDRRQQLATWIVKYWGGITGNSDDTIMYYVAAIDNAQPEQEWGFEGISSWSKIRSFVAPNNYAVYDSRVSAALAAIQCLGNVNNGVLFPYITGRARSDGSVAEFQRTHTRETVGMESWEEANRQTAYQEYCDLLMNLEVELQTNMGFVEMALFSKAPSLCGEVLNTGQ